MRKFEIRLRYIKKLSLLTGRLYAQKKEKRNLETLQKFSRQVGYVTVLENTPGIVLIDEVDLHLHPQWQQTILEDLKKIFPKVQFIVTSHAPAVINSVKRENVRMLDHKQIL